MLRAGFYTRPHALNRLPLANADCNAPPARGGPSRAVVGVAGVTPHLAIFLAVSAAPPIPLPGC
jgi:hypothetical protein